MLKRKLKLMLGRISMILTLATAAGAQTVCPPTPEFTPCDLVFDIPSANGDKPIDLQAEFRSPHQNTGLVKAFWDGGTRWIIRYTPAEPGNYAWRVTSTLPGLASKEGQFTATPVENKPGWLRAANVHHFAFVDAANPNNLTPHLWMGAMVDLRRCHWPSGSRWSIPARRSISTILVSR
jgi:hypothetical protein